MNPLGELINQAELEIDSEKVLGNKLIFGTTIGCSFDYKLSSSFSINVRPSYKYNFGDFSNAKNLTIKRNFFSIGLGMTKSF